MKEYKLDLGGGVSKHNGWLTVDILKGADVVWNLDKKPYPFKDNSIGEIFCSHTLEHLKEPELFFKECYRILKPGSRMTIRVPHYKHEWAYFGIGHRGFFAPGAIDYVCNPKGCLMEKPFKIVDIRIIYRNKLFWKPKEIVWIIEK